MKRKKLNHGKVMLFLILLGIIGFLLYYYLFMQDGREQVKNSDNTTTVKEEKKPKESSLSMLMVGDVLIHNSVYSDAKTGDTYDFSPMFTEVSDFVKEYDLAYYNQETVFGGKSLGYSNYPLFNTPSEIGDTMLDMGFNLISLSTNHTMDKGAVGAINSLSYWNSKKDVLTAGSYSSEEEREKVIIKEKNGIKYAMLSYTTLSNCTIPSGKSYLLDMYDKKKVKEDIERVRDKVDLLIVSMHWGTEYALQPNAQQKEIAAYLASLGVDIVIGTHTHSVQPIEYIDGTLVFYSLGNFISGQLYYDNLIGLMPTLKITKTEKDGKSSIQISDLEARLVYTYYKGGRSTGLAHSNYKVIPFDKITDVYFPDYKKYYEKYKNVITSLDDTIAVEKINE